MKPIRDACIPRREVLEDNEAIRYVDDLSEGQRQQRINLASELEAALNDPRWLAKQSTVT